MSEPHVSDGIDPEEYAKGDEPRRKRSENVQRRIARATRRQEAFALRRQGQSFDTIAQHLGVSPKTVSIWVREAIRAIPEEEAGDLRSLELSRLDAVLAPQMRLALAGDGFATDRVLRIMERRARYLNLDAQSQAGIEAVGNLLDLLVHGESS